MVVVSELYKGRNNVQKAKVLMFLYGIAISLKSERWVSSETISKYCHGVSIRYLYSRMPLFSRWHYIQRKHVHNGLWLYRLNDKGLRFCENFIPSDRWETLSNEIIPGLESWDKHRVS